MKSVLIILTLLIVAFIVCFFILGIMSKSGNPSGLVNGSLSRCPAKPNCVCSEYKDNATHYIEPIIITSKITVNELQALKNIIQEMGGEIQVESNNYIASTFSSSIFGFVDDLEVRVNVEQNVINLRSASRVGYGDFGVNLKRIELLKKLFNKKVSDEK